LLLTKCYNRYMNDKKKDNLTDVVEFTQEISNEQAKPNNGQVTDVNGDVVTLGISEERIGEIAEEIINKAKF